MLTLLLPHARHLLLTTPPNPRAVPAADLAARLELRERATVEPDPARALDLLLSLGGDTAVLCGSIYLVGDARRRLRELFGIPPEP